MTGAMARPTPADKPGSGLQSRLLAALVMAPPVLGAVYLGPPFLDILVLIGLAVLSSEWARLCDHQRKGLTLWIMVLAALAALLAARVLEPAAGLGVLAAGAAVMALIGRRTDGAPRLLFMGAVYLPLACYCFLWLRDQPEGRALAFWVMTAVWATDIGAYVAGKTIGGPKLLPSVSPKKTWAGLIGGMAAAGLLSYLAALIVEPWNGLTLMLLGCLLAVVSQVGDFFESGLKRHFGVKDASSLIPGHGGLLDRVDGLLMASLGAALFVFLSRGGGHGWL